jgi:tetratricopeptide (TPR) repeat protein
VLHRRAFEVLEGSGAPPAVLARHALAGGLAKEAFAYSMAAGDEAAEIVAVKGAIGHYERARDLLAAGEQQPGGAIEPSISDIEHLYSQLGRTYEMAERWEQARETYETMLALARELGEARLEVITLNHLAVLVFHHESGTSKVRALLERAGRVAEEAGLAEALAETECKLADLMAARAGEFEYSKPLAEKALASARAMGRPDLAARALTTLARVETFAGWLEEAAAHAEEGAALSRELAERSAPPQAEFRSLLAGFTGLSASWRAGAKAMEIRCLLFLANIRVFQGRLQEGMAVAREVRDIAEELPERMQAMSLWAIGTGLLGLGEYEELLALAKRGVEQARKARDVFLLGGNLGRLGEAYEALMNLKEAGAAYDEAMKVGHYGVFAHARYCVLAALSEDWEDAHVHARRAHEVGMFFNPLFSLHLHREIEALLRGGDEELAREEVRRFAERAKANRRDRMSHLRALAVLGEWEGDTESAIAQLREAEALAEEIGLPGELWKIRVKIGELHERRGEAEQAREAFARAAQILKNLAARIGDAGLREGFLAAPRVRSVLEHH